MRFYAIFSFNNYFFVHQNWLTVTISWIPDSFQLPNQTTDPSRPTKKTWPLKWNKHIAEYFLTILTLEENSIPAPCHQPVCSEWRTDKTGFLRKQHLDDGKERMGTEEIKSPLWKRERDRILQTRLGSENNQCLWGKQEIITSGLIKWHHPPLRRENKCKEQDFISSSLLPYPVFGQFEQGLAPH